MNEKKLFRPDVPGAGERRQQTRIASSRHSPVAARRRDARTAFVIALFALVAIVSVLSC